MGTEQILQLSRQDQEEFARVVNNLLLTSFVSVIIMIVAKRRLKLI